MRTLEEIFYANYQPSAKFFDLRLLAPIRRRAPSPVCEVELAGISHCGDNFSIAHDGEGDFCVLLCVFAGCGSFETPRGNRSPVQGDVMIVHPGAESRYTSSRESPWTLGWFNLRGSLMENLLISYRLADCWTIEGCNLQNDFRNALEELRKNDSVPELPAQLMLRLVQKIAAVRHDSGIQCSPATQKMLNLANRGFTGEIALEELARVSGLSRSQVIRRFRQATGFTPHRYMLERRLILAATLLGSSEKSVKEIAFSTGFSCEFHFSAMFKRRFGAAPAVFRRNRRGLTGPRPAASPSKPAPPSSP